MSFQREYCQHDCLLYVVSQTNQYSRKMSHKSVVRRLAKLVEEIWNKVDCCPYSKKTINKLLENEIWDKYKSLLQEHCLPRESLQSIRKRSHKIDHLNRSNDTFYFSILNIYQNFPLPFSYPK